MCEQLNLGRRLEALEGLKYVASLSSPDKLQYETCRAVGLVSQQDGDASCAK
jgi:hypothetical protein